jgi:hypothetical protein
VILRGVEALVVAYPHSNHRAAHGMDVVVVDLGEALAERCCPNVELRIQFVTNWSRNGIRQSG